MAEPALVAFGHDSVFRPADIVCRKAVFTVVLSFFGQTFASAHRVSAAHRMYTSGSPMCDNTSKYRDISTTPSLFYTGVKSAMFGLIAQERSSLSRCGLETKQDIFTIFELGVH